MQRYRAWFIFLGGTLLFFTVSAHQEIKSTHQHPLPILIIGGAMCDFFLELNQSDLQAKQEDGYIRFEEGKKLSLKTLICHTGGGGLNVALALQSFGHTAYLLAKIGNDANGERIKKELRTAGVSTALLHYDEENYTGTSFVLPSSRGNNTILMSRGANRHLILNPNHLDIRKETFAGVYIAPLSGASTQSALAVAQAAKNSGVTTMCNPSTEQIEKKDEFFKLLPNIDILLTNEIEASTIAQQIGIPTQTLEEQITLAQRLIAYGPHTCIITNGARGALCVTKTTILHQEPCPVIPQKTVGAGDTFGATFFGTLLAGYSIKTALLYGTLNSSSVLSKKVPHEGLLHVSTLEKTIFNTTTLPICHEL